MGEAANRSGKARCIAPTTCAATPVPTSSSSANGDIGNASGSRLVSTVVKSAPSSTARITSESSRIRTRLTTKPGESTTRTADFFSVLGDGECSGDRLVAGLLGTHHLDERHHRNRVEEVQPDQPLRMLQAGSHR